MFKWIKSLFTGTDLDNAGWDKEDKPKKDISEPVLMIVEVMRNYPSRFKIKFDAALSTQTGTTLYLVRDLKTKQSIVVGRRSYYTNRFHIPWEWLTNDERTLLSDEGELMQNKKMVRKNRLARARMKELYK